jgi:hypothetical protein
MACPLGRLVFVFALGAQAASARALLAQDWLQLGANAARTNYVPQAVSPPYRARWIWCGPGQTLRNKAAHPQWPDDLRLGHGKGADYPLPAAVPFTFAGRMQPVTSGTRAFVADMDGKVYALARADGKTLRVGDNPGGTWCRPWSLAFSLTGCRVGRSMPAVATAPWQRPLGGRALPHPSPRK